MCLLAINSKGTKVRIGRKCLLLMLIFTIACGACLAEWLTNHLVIRVCNDTNAQITDVQVKSRDGVSESLTNIGPFAPRQVRWLLLKCIPHWHCGYTLTVRFENSRVYMTEERHAEPGQFCSEHLGLINSTYD